MKLIELLKTLSKENSCKFQVLGDIQSGLHDTDIIFANKVCLKKFRYSLHSALRSSEYSFKIEFFRNRISGLEVKYHIYNKSELIGQFDLWLIVQRKGQILYRFDEKYSIVGTELILFLI